MSSIMVSAGGFMPAPPTGVVRQISHTFTQPPRTAELYEKHLRSGKTGFLELRKGIRGPFVRHWFELEDGFLSYFERQPTSSDTEPLVPIERISLMGVTLVSTGERSSPPSRSRASSSVSGVSGGLSVGSPGLVGMGSLPMRSPLTSPLLHPSPPIAAVPSSSLQPFPPSLTLPSTAEPPAEPQWFFTLRNQEDVYQLRARTRDDMHDWKFAFQRSIAFLIDRILKDRQTARRKSVARRGSNAFDGRVLGDTTGREAVGIGIGIGGGGRGGVFGGLSNGGSGTQAGDGAEEDDRSSRTRAVPGAHTQRGRMPVPPPPVPFVRSSSDGVSRAHRDGGLSLTRKTSSNPIACVPKSLGHVSSSVPVAPGLHPHIHERFTSALGDNGFTVSGPVDLMASPVLTGMSPPRSRSLSPALSDSVEDMIFKFSPAPSPTHSDANSDSGSGSSSDSDSGSDSDTSSGSGSSGSSSGSSSSDSDSDGGHGQPPRHHHHRRSSQKNVDGGLNGTDVSAALERVAIKDGAAENSDTVAAEASRQAYVPPHLRKAYVPPHLRKAYVPPHLRGITADAPGQPEDATPSDSIPDSFPPCLSGRSPSSTSASTSISESTVTPGGAGASSSGTGAWVPAWKRNQTTSNFSPVASEDVYPPSPPRSPEPQASTPTVTTTVRARHSCESRGSATFGMFSTQGPRSYMEDIHVVVEDMTPLLVEHSVPGCADVISYYAVMDGHCGRLAAEYASEKLHLYALQHEKLAEDPCAAFHHGILRLDEEFCRAANEQPTNKEYHCGTTVVAVMLKKTSVVVCNLGDCRVVLSRGGRAHPLSADHTPVSDRDRIEAAGGWVTTEREICFAKLQNMELEDPIVKRYAEDSVTWVDVSRVNGELGVARSLGDADYKRGARMADYPWAFPKGHATREFTADLVSNQADVHEFPLIAGDRFLVLACDGLWDVVSSEHVVELVHQFLDTDGNDPELACERLVDLAIKLGSNDNITALIVLLPHESYPETVDPSTPVWTPPVQPSPSADSTGGGGDGVGGGGGAGAGAGAGPSATLSLTPLSQPPVDETTISLMLLSDLTPMMPPDVSFDFQVDGFALKESEGYVAIMIDNNAPILFATHRCEVKGLSVGYHLLRAYLVQGGSTPLCVKSPMAYVEAEFHVVAPGAPEPRCFMFGQPSLAHLSPREVLSPSSLESGFACDFFAHNCEITSDVAHGFAVKVYVNGEVAGIIRNWTAAVIRGAKPLDGKLRVRLLLVNPAGEDVIYPPWNAEEHVIEVLPE